MNQTSNSHRNNRTGDHRMGNQHTRSATRRGASEPIGGDVAELDRDLAAFCSTGDPVTWVRLTNQRRKLLAKMYTHGAASG